ncbi:MAG: hypothetical protein LN408_06380, partial [Candidatus Thermoplasmatota archaeon]|nr:hypothetical protein [Candidatus Thermoplasmatota archaeon]
KFIERFLNLLDRLTENPELKLSEIDILTKAEKKQIIFDFNNTKTEYPKEKTIVQLFEEQAEKSSEKI